MTNQTLPPRSTPTPDPDPTARRASGRVSRFLSSHPRRSLLAVFLFVLVAGFFGGPLAGSLDSSGGFASDDADSVRAIERIEAATGTSRAPASCCRRHPGGRRADADRVPAGDRHGRGRVRRRLRSCLRRRPAAIRARLVSHDGTQVLVLATLSADAADGDVLAQAVLDDFDGQDDVTVGGSSVADLQIGDTVTEDLGRAEMMAFPLLILLSLVFFRGRGALIPLVVGMTTVLGTFLVLTGVNQLYGLSIFALNLVIGLGLGLAIDYRPVPASPATARSWNRQGADQRCGAHHDAYGGPDRRVLRQRRRGGPGSAHVFPLGFIKSMGLAGATVAVVAAVASLVIRPRCSACGAPSSPAGTREGRRARPVVPPSHAVMRRPGAVAVATGVVMLAFAAPALRAEWTPSTAR